MQELAVFIERPRRTLVQVLQIRKVQILCSWPMRDRIFYNNWLRGVRKWGKFIAR